ncbi:pentapeptide repeat-containing protein [Geodermatophilus chilensis]|uniref:pentapeptide repeat-containing protein n=1 Tax=Geodermatophilus chilensis TaxID=2035835 RepID=UPI000C26B6DB|nr:pentapeptide repeat-containing protein [Geodermatophilus chilensis]
MPDAVAARTRLRADCSRCAGLCCVAPAFAASADFAIDKPAGQACPNLRDDDRCGIHAELRERGFPGCTVFDCFGAGQHTVQVTFAGAPRWRDSPEQAAAVFAAFGVQRLLHELLWYLTEALALDAAAPLHRELAAAHERTARLTDTGPDELAAVDAGALQAEAGALLLSVSELARAGVRPRAGGRRRADRRDADLVGADLRHTDLRGVSLRGALLLGADLRGAALHLTDLLGTDLRAADVRGTDLSGVLFLTRRQVAGARGDRTTVLPAGLEHPPHWSAP